MAQPLHLTMEGTSSSHHVRMAHPLHLTLTHQKVPALTSDLDSSKWPSPYIWPSLVKMALSLRLRIPGNWPGASIQRMATTLISDQVGTYPSISSEWPCTYIWSCETTSISHIRMALSPSLSIPCNWPSASIPRMTFSPYIWSYRDQSYSNIIMA